MKLKYFLIIAILVAAFLGFVATTQTNAQGYTAAGCLTLSSESEQIACLQNIIAEITAQIQALLGSQGWCHTFNTNLGYANSGNTEVGYLHTALNKQGFSYAPDAGNTYAAGTASGVSMFQEKYASEILAPYGLTKGTGFTGVSTRAKLNALYACGVTPQQTRCNSSYQCVVGGSGVSCSSNSDCSAPQSLIVVTSPNNAATWTKGSTYTVTWSSSSNTGYVSIALKDDTRQSAGAIWSVNNVVNSGYYSFILPSFSTITPGNKYRICVS
ncbi:MAG: hypothetical protein ABIJ84_02560, partial [bacterium]